MRDSVSIHPALGRSLTGVGSKSGPADELRSFGHEGIDQALDGGIACGRLHEIFGTDPDEAGTAAGFAAMLSLRIATPGSSILWLREESAQVHALLHAPGLVEIGLDPARLIIGVLPDPVSVLRSSVDSLRCPALGAVVIEIWRNPKILDLTASRRIALAAEASAVTPLLLRIAAKPRPSAAHTRWQVSSASSCALDSNAPGLPALDLTLMRRRGGPAGMQWCVEWDRDSVCFREPAIPGLLLPLPRSGSLEAGAGRLSAG